MFSLINRGRYGQSIEEEFESLFARLRGLLSQTFDTDGNLIVADPNLAVVPVGAVMPYAGASAPAGYLMCDGSQVSRLAYKGLFDVVGTTYGAGDGSTTFHLPDLRQRFPLGKAASGTGNALGATGGNIDHSHSGGSHTHSFSATSSTNGSHTHGGGSTGANGGHNHGGPNASGNAEFESGGNLAHYAGGSHEHSSVNDHSHSIDSGGDHAHTVSGTTGSSSGTTGNANPPFIALNYIVFAGI